MQYIAQNSARFITASVASTLFALAATTASSADEKAPHADIFVQSANGALFTSGWDHTTGEVLFPELRVFEAEFGIDPSFPFSTDEPGIGSNLVGTTLTMNLLAGLGAWNGAGFSSTSAYLLASYGGQDAFSTTGGSFSFLVSEGLDLHPEYTLLGAGNSDPANGIYLASFTFSSAGLADSDTLYVVFNLGMSEADHEEAVAWVESNLVPAPSAIAMFAMIGLGGFARRRRS
jgi:hypothetical protein